MKVLKFGGSSVSNANNIRQVISILEREKEPLAVVVSAFGKVTDLLLEASNLASSKDIKYKEYN